MVRTEILPSGLIHTYSDSLGMGLLQIDTGNVYSEAVDVPGSGHTYEETPVEGATDEVTPEELEQMMEAVL